MTADRWMRLSDQDLGNAVSILSEAYTVGRLGREGFGERTSAAYSARTWDEVRDLTADCLSAAGARFSFRASASRGPPRQARPLALAQMVSIYFVVLMAVLAGRSHSA